jgi:glycopeptide antibiotics resistance protein
MILFLPFGFYTSYYLKIDKIKIPFLLTFIASISIEVVQMCIGRVFDVDDIILNVIGGVLGYYIYSILRIIVERLPRFCRSEWFLNIVALIALIITILIII